MIGIIVTFVVCLLGLLLLFIFFLPHGERAEEHASEQTQRTVAGVSTTSKGDLDILSRSGKDDYLALRAIPALRSVRERFWRDRRRIVLLWLRELQSDVRILWEFRRFLVRNGLAVTLRQEAKVAFAAVIALLYLRIVRMAVIIVGPFATFQALKNAKTRVEELAILGGTLLSRVPDPKKGELEQQWAQHLQVLRAR